MFTEELVKEYERIGLRYVGIYLPSNAAGLNWKEAYPDPDYRWSTTTLSIKQQDRYTFDNGSYYVWTHSYQGSRNTGVSQSECT